MASWASVEGNLADGLPFRVFVAEHNGQLWSASLHDDGNPLSEDDFLKRLGGQPKLWQRLDRSGSTLLEAAEMQVMDYFAGRQLTFDLPFHMRGTPFQVQVWRQLQRIPFGVTKSYRDIAAEVDNAKAVRAVGGANGKNNLPLFIPCHRVVAANGKLGGFTGGVELKRRLLAHEAAVLVKRQAA